MTTRDEAGDGVFVVGVGGTLRPGSSTEQAVRAVLRHATAVGASVRMFAGPALDFPMYAPGGSEPLGASLAFIGALRGADAVVLASPAYHGGISGLIKNALDYTEEMARDEKVYLAGRAIGCVASGADWQGASATVSALRDVAHALNGWPTPLGIVLNSREPLFDSQGEPVKPEIDDQFRLMARQLIDFAATRRIAKGGTGGGR